MSFIINLAYSQKIADSIAALQFAVNQLVGKLKINFVTKSEQQQSNAVVLCLQADSMRLNFPERGGIDSHAVAHPLFN
jgi:hypothetical protein